MSIRSFTVFIYFLVCTVQVCGIRSVIPEGIKLLRPGGVYVLVGMVHPDSKMDVTAEQIIRKCITIKGLPRFFLFVCL